LVGQFIPTDYLRPKLINKDISLNDYYTRAISIVGAVATIIATMVALFKEDIKRIYEKASLNINFKDKDKLSEVLDLDSEGESSSSNLTAKKYEVRLLIVNSGRLAARGCQIYLERILFTAQGSTLPKEYEPSGNPLVWQGKSELAIVVPSKGRASVTVFEILSPQSTTVASDSSVQPTTLNPQIKISGAEFSSPVFHGLYEFFYSIYSENSGPVEFAMKIRWDGKWHQRMPEMKGGISIT